MNELDEFINELTVIKGFNTKWEKDFGQASMKIGDTELIRKPQRWLPKTGMGYQPQPISDTYATLTIDRNVQIGFDWGAFEDVLSIQNEHERYFVTATNQQANQWDDWAAEFAYLNTQHVTGILGTNPTSLQTSQDLFLSAYAILQEMGCPKKDLTAVLSPRLSAAVVSWMNTNFNPQSDLGTQYRSGDLMTRLLGFDRVSVDANIRSHQAGTFVGTPAVATASVNGDTQLLTSGWTAGDTLNPGDEFSVAATKDVNPKNRRSTGQPRPFVVGGSVTLTADSGGLMTIPLGGGDVMYDQSQQYANLDNLPAAGALITVFDGTTSPSGKRGAQAVAFGRQAFGFACIALPKLSGCYIAEVVTDPETGISLAIHKGSDLRTYEKISRVDTAGGFVDLYSLNESVRMMGA